MSLKFNIKPYFDDFRDNTTVDGLSPKEKYHKILFRPAHAVQARELTQLQSILQNQVTSMGNHLFKEGAMIIPGHVSASTTVDYIKLQSSSAADLKDLIGKTIVATNASGGTTTGLEAIVVAVVEAAGSDLDTIYVQYQKSGDSSEKTFVAAEYLMTTDTSGFELQAAISSTIPIGFGSVAFLESGIYYIKGHFVVVQGDQLVLEKYEQTPSYDIGLKITESIVTSAEDGTLNDNANGTNNYAAPGAHRHQIKTELITQTIGVDTIGTDDDFLLLIQIDNGVIIKQVRATDYSVIEETLARRTFDESGNYTVRHFDIDIKEHTEVYGPAPAGDDTKLTAGLDASKAYIQGYEIETLSTINVDIDKARDSALFQAAAFPIQLGNYIDVNAIDGLPDITTFAEMSMYDGAHVSGSFAQSTIIGQARCRSVKKISGVYGSLAAVYRLYLFDITMNTPTTGAGAGLPEKFSSVKGFKVAVYNAPEFIANVVLDSSTGDAILQQPNRNSMVFKLPFTRVKTCESATPGDFNYIYDTVRKIGSLNLAQGQVTFSTIGTEEHFNGFDDKWILAETSTGNIINISSGSVNISGQDVTITAPSGTGDVNVTLIASTRRSALHKTKSLSTNVGPNEDLYPVATPTVDIQLGNADGYKLLNVYMSPNFTTDAMSDGSDPDVSEYYFLDNGHRDNYYDVSRLKLRSGTAFVPTGRLLVRYNYFTHSVGDFFSVDSYPAGVDYEDIPKYITANTGESIELRSAIDFRPRMDDTGSEFSGTGAVPTICPDPSSTFSTDVQYYLSRLDKLILDAKGQFSVIKGVSSLDPELPDSPKESMVLYHIFVPAYTMIAEEVETTLIDNKRYTMRDIGKLEKRIDNIEYYTALSLLESEAANKDIIDAAGLSRLKSGFIVDSFNTHSVGNVLSPDYKASIDRKNHRLRPLFTEKNIRLKYNANLSEYVVKTGNVITLPFSETLLFNQNKASSTINVNPYQVFEWTGHVELSPSQDEWKDTINRPKITVNQDGVYDAMMAIVNASDAMGTVWNSWQTNWTGVETSTSSTVNTLGHARGGRGKASDRISTTTITTDVQSRWGVVSSVTPTTINTSLGDRVVEINFAPFVRSRYVSFKANSMKPNTILNAFFDDVNINNWSRSDNTFVDFTGTDAEIEAQMLINYNNGATPPVALEGGTGDLIHPQGNLQLKTNDSGELTGSFWIPNTELRKFKTGTRVFRLSDDPNNSTTNETTSAATHYIAKGLIETKENVTISTRVPMLDQRQVFDNRTVVNTQESGASTRWWDPLAQSFLLDTEKQPYGAYITSIDLYFHSKSESLPVTLQLREMNQGIPTAVVIPFSNVTLSPSEVNVVDLELSNPSPNTSTTFKFDSPVYLQSGKEYCFVIMANSVDYELWYAGIGENDYDSGKHISKQPYAGVLFTSQNASTWSPDQNKDLKFKINRAKYVIKNTVNAIDYPSKIVLENESIPKVRLIKNALRTKAGTKVVRVFQKNHGFMEAKGAIKSYVTLSGIQAGTVNGIPSLELNKTHAVSNVEQDSYEITVATTNATFNGIDGGTDIYATENMMYNTFYTSVQSMNFPVTKSTWDVFMTHGVSLGDQISIPYKSGTSFHPVIINRNFHIDSPRIIASDDNSTTKTFTLQGELSSKSDYVTPIIDLERCSVIGVQNRIDNPVDANEYPLYDGYNKVDNFVPETSNTETSGLAKYLTKNISLKEISNEIKLFIDVNRPSGTFVDVYYKTHTDDELIGNSSWTGASPTEAIPYSDNVEEFREVEYTISPGDFSVFALKIVFRSINSSRVPQCKDLRAIAVKK